MTDIEQRKASAYDTMPTRGYETYEAWAYDNFDLIHDLLQPSPQSPDIAVAALLHKLEDLIGTPYNDAIEKLAKLAQQPKCKCCECQPLPPKE